MAITFEQAAAQLRGDGDKIERGVPRAVGRTALFMQGRVRANMNGRPGLNRITGGMIGAVSTQPVVTTSVGVTGGVSSNHPAARRHEHGFSDTDRLGRVYDQRPFPAWAPAVKPTEKYLGRELGRLLK